VGNSGYITRQTWTAGGRSLFLAGPLFIDTWIQDQYFTDNFNISIKFTRHTPEFCLQRFTSGETFNVNIKRMRMWVRKVQVAPSVLQGHMTGLSQMNAKWNYNAHKIYTSFHIKGVSNISIPDCCPGIYPKLILAGFVSTLAYNSSYDLSPYNFKHCNVNSIGLKVNGQFTPSEPYTPNFANEDIRREYLSLFLSTGKAGIHDDDNGLLMVDFTGGSTLFPFNLSPDLFLSGHGEPARISNINMDILFSKPLDENVVLMLFCRYDTKIEITQLGNVILDPTQSAN